MNHLQTCDECKVQTPTNSKYDIPKRWMSLCVLDEISKKIVGKRLLCRACFEKEYCKD